MSDNIRVTRLSSHEVKVDLAGGRYLIISPVGTISRDVKSIREVRLNHYARILARVLVTPRSELVEHVMDSVCSLDEVRAAVARAQAYMATIEPTRDRHYAYVRNVFLALEKAFPVISAA